MCTKGIRGRELIDTLNLHVHRPWIDTWSKLDRQSTNFRRYAIKCRSILAVITRSVLVDTQPTYQSLPYGWLSVACQWYIGVVNHRNTTVSHPKHMLLCYQHFLGTFRKFLWHLLMIQERLGQVLKSVAYLRNLRTLTQVQILQSKRFLFYFT